MHADKQYNFFTKKNSAYDFDVSVLYYCNITIKDVAVYKHTLLVHFGIQEEKDTEWTRHYGLEQPRILT